MFLPKSVLIALMLMVLQICVSVENQTHSKGNKKKISFQNKENEVDENPIANTENGQVRGTRNQTTDLNKTYYAFKGIPFAKPPINDLRFEPPQPAENWEGIYQATNDSILCVQTVIPITEVLGQEDCLYLNVYTPNLPTTSNNKSNNDNLLAVMVFIYGGGFRSGSTSSLVYGPDFLIDREVVVVNINYRMGILGFISTNDLVAPGNLGLKDQNLALKWVQNNIENFGGDPKKITIFGQSAGSASVSYHLQSPKSKGLFRSAIMESGTTLCPWSLSRQVVQVTATVGKILGADNSSTKSFIEDLKKIDVERLQVVATIVEFEELLFDGIFNGLVYAPVIEPEHEGAFFTWKSHQQLSEGKFNRVPAIIGFNSQEGNAVANFSLPVQIYLSAYNFNVSKLIPEDMNVNNLILKYALGAEVKVQYFGLLQAVGADKRNSTVLISDALFNRPIRETVAQASKHVPIYFYRFSYIGLLGTGYASSAIGVAHAEELNYIWYRENILSSPKDVEVSRKFVDLWTNFAKYTNPTPKKDESLDNVIWPEARQNSTDCLTFIDVDYNLTISENPQKENIDFWNELYRDYGNPPYTTY